MLTPNINDPNREKELERKEKDPDSFGPAGLAKKPEDEEARPNSQLNKKNRK